MCAQLVRAGADPNATDAHGRDANQWALTDMPSRAEGPTLPASHRRSHIDQTATKFVNAVSRKTVGGGRRIYGQQEVPSTRSTRATAVTIQQHDPLAEKRRAKEQCIEVLTGAKRALELRAGKKGYAMKLKTETRNEARTYLKGKLAAIKLEIQQIRQHEDEIMATMKSPSSVKEPEPKSEASELEPEPSS